MHDSIRKMKSNDTQIDGAVNSESLPLMRFLFIILLQSNAGNKIWLKFDFVSNANGNRAILQRKSLREKFTATQFSCEITISHYCIKFISVLCLRCHSCSAFFSQSHSAPEPKSRKQSRLIYVFLTQSSVSYVSSSPKRTECHCKCEAGPRRISLEHSHY